MHMPASLSGDLKERLFEIGYDVSDWRTFA